VKKVYYSWKDIDDAVNNIILQLFNDGWRPEYIVGLTRGGLAPAVMLSNKTGIPMYTLDVRLRDTPKDYTPEDSKFLANKGMQGHKILIVDDINDTGETLNWIWNSWNGEWPCKESKEMWHHCVKTATVTNNEASDFEVDYSVIQINKIEEDCWIVYPWEV
jgi:hypoxanthine phosphoribosyltransferase